MFQKPNRIHMTLGTMNLESDQASSGTSGQGTPIKAISDALKLLESLRPELRELLGDLDSISLPLSRLAIMNGKREEAFCMYTGPGLVQDDSAMWKVCCKSMSGSCEFPLLNKRCRSIDQ